MENVIEDIFDVVNISTTGPSTIDRSRRCRIIPNDERIEVGTPEDGYIIHWENVKSINIDIMNLVITYVD